MSACGVSEWNAIVDMGLDEPLAIGLEHVLGGGLENGGIGDMVHDTRALHRQRSPAPEVGYFHEGGCAAGSTGPIA